MGRFIYVAAVVLLIIWAISYFAFSAHGLIHILLIVAAVAILVRVIFGPQRL